MREAYDLVVLHKIHIDSATCSALCFMRDHYIICGLSNYEIQVQIMAGIQYQVFDLRQKQLATSLAGHSAPIQSLFLLSDTNQFVSFDTSGILNVLSLLYFLHSYGTSAMSPTLSSFCSLLRQ